MPECNGLLGLRSYHVCPFPQNVHPPSLHCQRVNWLVEAAYLPSGRMSLDVLGIIWLQDAIGKNMKAKQGRTCCEATDSKDMKKRKSISHHIPSFSERNREVPQFRNECNPVKSELPGARCVATRNQLYR